MTRFMARAKSFLRDEEGATMVEYGILVALISVVSILIIASLGLYIQGAFDTAENELKKAAIPKGGAPD